MQETETLKGARVYDKLNIEIRIKTEDIRFKT